MTRLYVLVEGYTEKEFVKQVLEPHLQAYGVWVHTIIVQTSRDADGHKNAGGGKWRHWRRDLEILTAQQTGPAVRFTTLFDLYGLPSDFPELEQHTADPDTSRRAEKLAAAMARAVPDSRLIPYIQRHEFEALVLAGLNVLATLLDDATDIKGVQALRAILQRQAPEDINDGPLTAPLKRLKQHIPSFRKTVHGLLTVQGAGLVVLRQACPCFNAWVQKLEALGRMPSKPAAAEPYNSSIKHA